MKPVIAYLATLIAFAIVDTLWLGVVARAFYQAELGSLRAERIDFRAAVAFYLVFAAGIVVFAVLPALRAESLGNALLYGALFGFFCYATYDLTNLATLRDWPLRMSLVDIAWGTVLTASTATVATAVTRWLT